MIMKRLLLATFVALAFAAGCGGSSQLASNTNDNARPSATSLERSPLRVTLENGTVIALDPSGLITVDGERLGDLQPDGRVTGTDGADLAALVAQVPDARLSDALEILARAPDARVAGEGRVGFGVTRLSLITTKLAKLIG